VVRTAIESAIPELALPTSTPTEWSEVERPLLLHLAAIGWQYMPGDIDIPELTERENFRQVVLYKRLREAIKRINDDDGIVDDLTVDRAIRALEAVGGQPVLEKNRIITERIIKGVPVESTEPGAQRQRWIRFIEFDPAKIDLNDFLAVNQLRVDLPGRGTFVIPDVVLFVNGLPLVVVECKSPGITDPIGEGLDQVLRYSNNRYWVDEDEGIEDLFLFNQLMAVSCYYKARLGTLGAYHEHYMEWKDPSPLTREQVAEELGKTPDKLKSQELLAAGVLRPERLIDILRNFVLFKTEDGRLIKIAPRYQQYRAVHLAVEKLRTGNTRQQDEKDQDRRGGIIWHTQGSGKSITMVYLVRKMRTIPELRSFKVVIITDRSDLENQLRETATLTGEVIRPDQHDEKRRISATETLKAILREDSPDIVFAMIQKYLQRKEEAEVFQYEVPIREKLLEAADPQALYQTKTKVLKLKVRDQEFEVLNESPNILILIDEAHRSHTKTFHANMMKSLPNAAKIGFTGTPIMWCDQATTQSIFGEFIDKYRLNEAVEDEATVKIVYEGRTTDGLVEHTDRLDRKFEDFFRDYTEKEKQVIKNKYAAEGDVLEAPKLIAEKATDMLRHYLRAVLPNGFKSQVVAVSRLAAIRYRDALEEARNRLVQEIESLDPVKIRLSREELEQEDEYTQFLVGAAKSLETIRRLEFAAVVSHNHNDPPSWREWTDKAKQDANIARFKKPLVHPDSAKQDGVAFLCVKSMLTTGFDAPVEQVLYLDRRVVAHELLQTIARVNRRIRGKDCGYIVDYIGVARHLHEALGDYDDETHDPMIDVRDEVPKLRDRHTRAVDVFLSRGIPDIRDIEACVDLLADVKIRVEFINKLRLFLESLGIVMPRPEAMAYLKHAKILGFIAKVAANLYYDEQLNLYGVKHKVKQLIDEYIAANGIDTKIPPIEILDVNFADHVNTGKSAKARASRMLHAARHHISIHLHEDPTLFTTLSAKLEQILQDLRDNWAELEKELQRFIDDELKQGREQEIEGLDPKIQAPFFGLLKEAIEKSLGRPLGGDAFRTAVTTIIEIVDHIKTEIGLVGFWRDPPSRQRLENWVFRSLRRSRLIRNDQVQELAIRFVDLAKSRHRFLVT
jgi:type I restriction enzyme R subunit